jgi:aryl-alcohol dehydrogenase-like predicted oxidoreductase
VAQLGRSDLDVFGLCLGGNVFGWTADEPQSFEVLDAYAAAGGNFIDSSDSYSAFAPGNQGGESETVLGNWFAARGNRSEIVLATKVGRKPDRQGLSRSNIRAAIAESLERLQSDYIDLYYAHADDPDTPLEETLRAFDELVKEGKVKYIAASNYRAPRLAQALEISDREGIARYVALQPHYSLVERDQYEGELSELCVREELSCVPYWALARGFLTGKYRPGATDVDSGRAGGALDPSKYLTDERGPRVIAALDEVARAHGAEIATVALAWLAAAPTVTAPIASARTTAQLPALLAVDGLELTEADLAKLDEASA